MSDRCRKTPVIPAQAGIQRLSTGRHRVLSLRGDDDTGISASRIFAVAGRSRA